MLDIYPLLSKLIVIERYNHLKREIRCIEHQNKEFATSKVMKYLNPYNPGSLDKYDLKVREG